MELIIVKSFYLGQNALLNPGFVYKGHFGPFWGSGGFNGQVHARKIRSPWSKKSGQNRLGLDFWTLSLPKWLHWPPLYNEIDATPHFVN